MKSRSRVLADKSLDAMLAAIEVYNKPDFSYREETFAILSINAWELVLKARILQLANNKVSSILKYERRRRADGELSEKLYRVKNRSGNYLSIGLFKSIDLLENEYGDRLETHVAQNIELICEVRDNAIHFVNKGFDLSLLVQQLGTANLRNYLLLVRRWFGTDLSKYNFFLMPLAFFKVDGSVQSVHLNADEKKLTNFLQKQTQEAESGEVSDFNVALNVDIKFSKSKDASAQAVRITNNPDATAVVLTEEDIRDKYPWDYNILTTRLKKRYSDFKTNNNYHEIRRPLEDDEKFCKRRFLDPMNQTGTGKNFYNPNIIKEFDAHYEKNS